MAAKGDAWVPVGSLHQARLHPAAAVLNDGRVLVVGGTRGAPTAELYDPRSRTWARAPDPPSGFENPVAAFKLGNSRVVVFGASSFVQASARPPTVASFDSELGWLLEPDAPAVGGNAFAVAQLDADNVLVAGGIGATGLAAAADTYSARGDAWLRQPPLPAPRAGAQAAPLGGGKAIVVGGYGPGGPRAAPLDSAVIYTGSGWQPAASYPGLAKTNQLLAIGPGRVLAVIGDPAGLATYDLATNTWTPAATGPHAGLAPGVVMADGRILFAGTLFTSGVSQTVPDAELYDPRTNSWSSLAPMAEGRFLPTLVALPNGGVLAIGGGTGTVARLSSVEVFGGPPPPPGTASTVQAPLPQPGWLTAGVGLAVLGFLGLLVGSGRRRLAGGVGRLALQLGGVILLTWALLASAHLLVSAQLGQSKLAIPTFFNQPLAVVLWQATERSLVLVAFAALGATVVGLGTAVLVVSLRERRLVGLELAGAVLLVLPTFLLAILVQELQAYLYGRTGLIVAAGYGDVNGVQVFWAAVVLGLRPATYLYRHGRAVLDRESGEDYVRTAEAKGLPWSDVVRRHLLRAGGSSLIATWANSFRLMIGSLPLVEYFFGYPGLGRVLVQSIGIHYGVGSAFPKPVVLRGDLAIGLVVILALVLILVESTAGGLQRWLDPRLRAVRSAA